MNMDQSEYDKPEPCNLVLYKDKGHKKKGESGYSKIVRMAHEIAEGMSEKDRLRLLKNPTPETLKNIMENK